MSLIFIYIKPLKSDGRGGGENIQSSVTSVAWASVSLPKWAVGWRQSFCSPPFCCCFSYAIQSTFFVWYSCVPPALLASLAIPGTPFRATADICFEIKWAIAAVSVSSQCCRGHLSSQKARCSTTTVNAFPRRRHHVISIYVIYVIHVI